ncbi:MAG: heavy metal translocating P-type ATPase, partial [Sphingobacteriales bacterium]
MKDCCAINSKPTSAKHAHDHGTDGHNHAAPGNIKEHAGLLGGLAILIFILVLNYGFNVYLSKWPSLAINLVAYLLAGWNVLGLAMRKVLRGDLFNEFVLMSVATLGAFYIGEYAEGVAVMVFYSIGEWFQDAAVNRAKASIKALLDVRPDQVTVVNNGKPAVVASASVAIGAIIQLKPGEKLALDGEMISERGAFNTAALTGESKPDNKYAGEQVLAGMINLNTLTEVRVTALYKDSKLSRILELVQDAAARKSQTQLFISRFARAYTPIVFFLALALTLMPALFVQDYIFNDWLYRALVFLVISCPCALVVSI